MSAIRITVPASTSNLGPGFETLGLAVSLRNRFTFTFNTDKTEVINEGFGAEQNRAPEENLVVQSFHHRLKALSGSSPTHFHLHCENNVPFGSGLGSSSTAITAGLLAADAWLGKSSDKAELLSMATEIEGHPDNVTPSIFGGLTASALDQDGVRMKPFPVADWKLAIVVPNITIATKVARAALPKTVSLPDAVYNLNRIVFLMKALAEGDEDGLNFAMRDKLHQQYRMKLFSGSEDILAAAVSAGASAAGISGAGPGIIAYTMCAERCHEILQAMTTAAKKAGYRPHAYELRISSQGASAETV
ncbi:MAG: homoserine kinase [Chloroflexi bacterium]|nr:homoserine kinase [Chloroflexota bacterium]